MGLISKLLTSNSTDDENGVVLSNKLMDIILNYAKEYQFKQFDPYIIRQKNTINFNAYSKDFSIQVSKFFTNFIITLRTLYQKYICI